MPKNLVELSTVEILSNFEATISVDSPNESLYQTKGKLVIENRE